MFCKYYQENIKNVLVIGSLYDKINKLDKIQKIINNYDLIIINGNICYPDDGYISDRIALIDNCLQNKKFVYNAGNFDYQIMKKYLYVENWLKDKPNSIHVKFARGTSLIVVNGGISENDMEGLESNLKITFLSRVGGVPWHHKYSGRMGYVISNNPLSDDPPEFFNYSARIGTKFSKNNKIYAQEANEHGLQKTFLL